MKILILIFILLYGTQILAQEVVKLAAEDDWHPYSSGKSGVARGLSVDIVNAAYTAAGIKLALDVVPFNRGMALTKVGVYDGVFNATIDDSLRKDYVAPKARLTLSEQIVYGRTGGPVFVDESSFSGKSLGLTLGYTYPDSIINNPAIQKQNAPSDQSNFQKLARGRIDFTIVDRLVALSVIAKNRSDLEGKIKPVGRLPPVVIQPLFNKSPAGVRAMELFDQGMSVIAKNGTLARINA